MAIPAVAGIRVSGSLLQGSNVHNGRGSRVMSNCRGAGVSPVAAISVSSSCVLPAQCIPVRSCGIRGLLVQQGSSRRRGGAVVCEVAVEVGGSRSSEGEESKIVEAGSRIRVKGPLKVYHVPKNPELDIGGMEGEVKDVVTTYKGKPISATLPYKVQMVLDGEEKKIKFFVHLKKDEFDVLE